MTVSMLPFVTDIIQVAMVVRNDLWGELERQIIESRQDQGPFKTRAKLLTDAIAGRRMERREISAPEQRIGRFARKKLMIRFNLRKSLADSCLSFRKAPVSPRSC